MCLPWSPLIKYFIFSQQGTLINKGGKLQILYLVKRKKKGKHKCDYLMRIDSNSYTVPIICYSCYRLPDLLQIQLIGARIVKQSLLHIKFVSIV
jgi:hypothetical protein